LKPITNVLPKPLFPIGEKTILELIMDRFCEIQCNHFYISLNYKSGIIKQYLDSLKDHEYNIVYIEEDRPLGTAGSLHLLKDTINSTFFVSNCDIIIDTEYGEIYDYHIQNKNDLTIVGALKHYSIPYGTITTGKEGMMESFSEKPEFTFQVNSGMYILEAGLLHEIPEGQSFDITDLIKNLQDRNGKIGVFPVSEKSWKDIGNWNDYLAEIKKNQ
jgi:NDP-sugar pyrophosphorylase family protein